MNEVTQEMIDKAIDDFHQFDRCPLFACPKPTRTFEIGEEVKLGNLDDCIIAEKIDDGGKIYRVDITRKGKDNRSRKPFANRETMIRWWHELDKLPLASNVEELYSPYLPGHVSTMTIDSFFHQVAHNGVVCDPEYQRGYVWTEQDQVDLIDSIFNRINIGSFVFIRHHGYLHEKSGGLVTYINLDGDEFTIDREQDYTNSIVDGQQRLTTIWKFYTNQFKYKGLYHDEMNFRDRCEFENTTISTRTINEDDVNKRDIFDMFIKINRGVPQDESHLDAIKDKMDKL